MVWIACEGGDELLTLMENRIFCRAHNVFVPSQDMRSRGIVLWRGEVGGEVWEA